MNGSDTTVLVVDDDPDLAEVYSTFLGDEYHVLQATSGREALKMATDAIDVVLLDQRMPDHTGDEVLRELRNRGVDAPVGMLSGIKPTSSVEGMGFDDYVVKPIDRDDILGLVESLRSRESLA